MLPWIARDWVEFYEPGGVEDDYGEGLPDWNLPPTLVERIEFCSVQPVVGAGENTLEREAITTRWVAWIPGYHPRLAGTQRVKVPYHDGLLQVEGAVPYFPDPTGLALDHHYCILKEVEG